MLQCRNDMLSSWSVFCMDNNPHFRHNCAHCAHIFFANQKKWTKGQDLNRAATNNWKTAVPVTHSSLATWVAVFSNFDIVNVWSKCIFFPRNLWMIFVLMQPIVAAFKVSKMSCLELSPVIVLSMCLLHSKFVLEVQLAFHKEQVFAHWQLEVQLSQHHGRLQKIHNTIASSTAVLVIASKLICCTMQISSSNSLHHFSCTFNFVQTVSKKFSKASTFPALQCLKPNSEPHNSQCLQTQRSLSATQASSSW